MNIDDLKLDEPVPAMNPSGKSAASKGGLSPKEFEQLVADAFTLVPEKFRSQVKNVALLVEDEPSAEVLKENNVPEGHTLFGHNSNRPACERLTLHQRHIGLMWAQLLVERVGFLLARCQYHGGVSKRVAWGRVREPQPD